MTSHLDPSKSKKMESRSSGVARTFNVVSHLGSLLLRVPAQALYCGSAISMLLLIVASANPPQILRTLNAQQIQSESGKAYIAPVLLSGPFSGLVTVPSDSTHAPSRSSLQLLEDGAPLGPPHSNHDAIRVDGGGRYSHWNSQLYFSTSDGTDPRVNGRTYKIRAWKTPASWIYFAIVVLMGFSALRWFLDRPLETRGNLLEMLRLAISSTKELNLPPATTGVLVLVGILAGPTYVAYVWYTGTTVSLALAGFLPMSDAKGYLSCADVLLQHGTTPPWCQRRPIYPTFLATLSMLLGRDLHLIILAQATLVSIAMTLFIREIARWLGPIIAILAGSATAYVATGYTLNQLMTEVLGLSIGLLSISVLLRAAELKSPVYGIPGLAGLSLAMNVRPGALFVLGTLVAWIVWTAWTASPDRRRILVYLGASLGAASTGFIISAAIVHLQGGTPTGLHGSFAYVLYGLSVGGDWTTVLTDHPELNALNDRIRNHSILLLAASEIAARPMTFIASLYANARVYLDEFLLIDTKLYLVAICLTTWRARQDPRAALILAFALGELASAPLIAGDGGQRVFAVTAPIQIMPILVVLGMLFQLFTNALSRTCPMDRATSPRQWHTATPTSSIVMLCLISSLLIPPLIFPRQWTAQQSAVTSTCERDYHTVVTRLNSGGPRLIITPDASTPEIWPRRISQRDLEKGVSPADWYAESVMSLPSITLIIAQQHGISLPSNAPPVAWSTFQQERFLYHSTEISLPISMSLKLCVDSSQILMIAEAPYFRIVSYETL